MCTKQLANCPDLQREESGRGGGQTRQRFHYQGSSKEKVLWMRTQRTERVGEGTGKDKPFPTG